MPCVFGRERLLSPRILNLPRKAVFVLTLSCPPFCLLPVVQIYLMGLVNNPDTSQGLKLWRGFDPAWEKILRWVLALPAYYCYDGRA